MTELVKSLKLTVFIEGKNIIICEAEPKFPDEVKIMEIKRKQLKRIYKMVKEDKIYNRVENQGTNIMFA